jgi:Glyoxalase/Bleomycin resistance protein/Dioxygenase superfamily
MPVDFDLLDVRHGQNPLGAAPDHEVVRRDAPIDEEVRARTNCRRVDSEIAEHRRRGDIQLRLTLEQPSVVGSQQLERGQDSGVADDHRGFARLRDLLEREKCRLVELGSDPSRAFGQLIDPGSCVDRTGELPSLGRVEIEPDLPVGEGGRLTRLPRLLGRRDDDDRRRDPEVEKKMEIPLGEHRWLTVVSPDDPDGTQLVLEPDAHPAAKPFKAALVSDGIPVASFTVDDVEREFKRLRSLGVDFTQEPTQMGPVKTAVFDDTCGNLIQIADSS